MDNVDEKKVDVLMAEYSALKSEILVQVQIYNQQSGLIQVYGGLLFGMTASYMAFLSWTSSASNSANLIVPGGLAQTFFWSIVFMLASSIAFYFVSSVMSHAYMFRILRMRMASIEKSINTLTGGKDTLIYESLIAPHFLEERKYGDGVYTPYALSGFWRLMTLVLFIAILSILSFFFLPEIIALAYIAILILCIIFHVRQYMSLLTGNGHCSISNYFSENKLKSQDEN